MQRHTDMHRKRDKRYADTDVRGQVASERIGMRWRGADKSGRHFCAAIGAIGKPGVKLVSLPLWFHARRYRPALSSQRRKGILEA